MSAIYLQQVALYWRLRLVRFGVVNLIAAILWLAAAIGWIWIMPHYRSQAATLQNQLAQARHDVTVIETRKAGHESTLSPPTDEMKLANFYDVLGETKHLEQQVATLLNVSEKTGLAITHADYKLLTAPDGAFLTYQITMPAKATYAQIRQFCEKTLLAIPFASLDEIDLKRETIASPVLESKLHLTLYLRDTPQASLRPAP